MVTILGTNLDTEGILFRCCERLLFRCREVVLLVVDVDDDDDAAATDVDGVISGPETVILF